MARIRSIKPEFWDDEKLAGLPRDARLLYIGMWTFSDDYGVIKSNPVWLKSKIFPYDDIQLPQFRKWLEMLERPGFSSPGGTLSWAIRFEAKGEAFYYLPNFSRHQKVDHPSANNRNPEPPKEVLDWIAKGGIQPRENLVPPREDSRETRAVLDCIGSEGRGEGEDAHARVGEASPPKGPPSSADCNRASSVLSRYPTRAKDGRAVRIDLSAHNLLAVKIAEHPAFEWEEAAELEQLNSTPLDAANWISSQPDPVLLATRRRQRQEAPKTDERTPKKAKPV